MNRTRELARVLAAVALLLPLVPQRAAAESITVTEVQVERVRPKKEKHATLRFLKENRDFIRARFDALREKERVRRVDAGEIDPRFLAYQDMLADILAARDSVTTILYEQQKHELFQSVTRLGDLERQLDLLGRLLGEQRSRLGVLQADFTGDQRTALMIVLSGDAKDVTLSEIDIVLDDGERVTIPLSEAQRESMRRGGFIEILHELVEPREQVVEVVVRADRWPAGDSGFVTLDPARDRLTLLRLDLSALGPATGTSGIRATTWIHESGLLTVDG